MQDAVLLGFSLHEDGGRVCPAHVPRTLYASTLDRPLSHDTSDDNDKYKQEKKKSWKTKMQKTN